MTWASLASEGARLMLALASAPVDPSQQAVLLYAHTEDVGGLRARLIECGIEVGSIRRPEHMPAGELRVADPDGYVMLVGQRTPAP